MQFVLVVVHVLITQGKKELSHTTNTRRSTAEKMQLCRFLSILYKDDYDDNLRRLSMKMVTLNRIESGMCVMRKGKEIGLEENVISAKGVNCLLKLCFKLIFYLVFMKKNKDFCASLSVDMSYNFFINRKQGFFTK